MNTATQPPVLDPLTVRCHYCGAQPGEPCTVPWRSSAPGHLTPDVPHAHRARAASAAHDGWENAQRAPYDREWWGLGTPVQGVLRSVQAASSAPTRYRPDQQPNPIHEWGAIRQGYYTWTPETGAQLTPLGAALLAQANQS